MSKDTTTTMRYVPVLRPVFADPNEVIIPVIDDRTEPDDFIEENQNYDPNDPVIIMLNQMLEDG